MMVHFFSHKSINDGNFKNSIIVMNQNAFQKFVLKYKCNKVFHLYNQIH